LHSIHFTDENTGWAAGCSYHNWTPDTGYIIKTTNGGDNWSVLIMDSSYTYRDVYFIDEDNGWAVGYYYVYDSIEGRILRTHDGGVNWELQDCDTCKELYAVHFTDAENGWAVGRSIYVTQDGGQNWTEQQYDSSGFILESIYFLNPLEGWIVGSRYGGNGIILHTENGGINWLYELRNRSLYDVHFKDEDNGLITSRGGLILFTQDGGITWIEMDTETDYALYSVFYAPNGQGYAGGEWGTIVKSNLLTVSVEEPTPITQNSKLNTHSYPNPTTGIFNLQFTIYNLQSVSVKMYDLHGREVATVIDQQFSEGEHVVSFDASSLPAGVYVMKLQAGGQMVTGKLLLMH
jgi:photosystem II stability/assembly factor-like uncharacterized protein